MWTVIVVAVLVAVVVVVLVGRRRRTARSEVPFHRLSREDQVQSMRHRQGDDGARGSRDSAKSHGTASQRDRFSGWG